MVGIGVGIGVGRETLHKLFNRLIKILKKKVTEM